MKNLSITCSAKDFSEALTVTRTLNYDLVTKTSIVEASLACAASTTNTFSVAKIASFIVNSLKVKDCFHKREQNKANDVMKSTILRVRHHVKDTIKTNHIADTLYSFDVKTDSVSFTDKYRKVCLTDKVYQRKVSALIKRVKAERTAIKNTKKAVKKSDSKKSNTKYSKKQIKAFNASRYALDSDVCRMQAQAMNCEYKAA